MYGQIHVTLCSTYLFKAEVVLDFVIIVNCFQPLTIITKCSILDAAAALDPPLV